MACSKDERRSEGQSRSWFAVFFQPRKETNDLFGFLPSIQALCGGSRLAFGSFGARVLQRRQDRKGKPVLHWFGRRRIGAAGSRHCCGLRRRWHRNVGKQHAFFICIHDEGSKAQQCEKQSVRSEPLGRMNDPAEGSLIDRPALGSKSFNRSTRGKILRSGRPPPSLSRTHSSLVSLIPLPSGCRDGNGSNWPSVSSRPGYVVG